MLLRETQLELAQQTQHKYDWNTFAISSREHLDQYCKSLALLHAGDQMLFGHYRLPCCCKPADTDCRMPISWHVIRREGARLLLFCDVCLDWEFYDGSDMPSANWETSAVRETLRNICRNSFRLPLEQKLIEQTVISPAMNPVTGIPGGSSTCLDQLFLLSSQEITENAAFIIMDVPTWGADQEDGRTVISDYGFPWWLRNPGIRPGTAACAENGQINLDGISLDADEIGIRPALWLNPENLLEGVLHYDPQNSLARSIS